MDVRNEFEQYLRPKKFRLIVGAACCIVAAILALIALFIHLGIIGATNEADAIRFNPASNEQEGKLAYVDVVALDKWAAHKDEKYIYVCEDPNGRFMAFCMSPSDESKFKSQQEYWAQLSGNGAAGTAPQPIRVYGVVTKMPSDLIRVLANTYGITSTELSGRIGTFYLDTTTAVKNSMAAPFLAGAVISAILGIILLSSYFGHVKAIRTCMDRLDREGATQKAWDELQIGLTNQSSGSDVPRIVLSENFIISKQDGVVVAYTDILWAYQHVMRRNFVVVNRSLVCKLADSKTLTLGFGNRKSHEDEIEGILSVVSTKNPTALIGFSSENSKRYEEMVR